MINKIFVLLNLLIIATILTGCATPNANSIIHDTHSSRHKPQLMAVDTSIFHDGCNPQILAQAEANASPAGAKILAQSRIMTVNQRIILRGGCWDYINAVWNKAGYPAKKRKNIFKSKKTGPYAKANNIQSGDWLYFINHSYGNIEHSAMFIDWADRDEMQACMLSYAGERRREPARYKMYDLTSVYQIIRPKK